MDDLSAKIKKEYFAKKQRYGSPRIYVELNKKGIKVSLTTVAKKMKQLNLKAKTSKRYKVATTDSNHSYPISPNLLNRNFKVDSRGKVWVSDITYIPTKEGFIYLTVIIDLYDRKVVGWSISEGMTAQETVLAAWYMALKNTSPQQGLIFHSDRGVQYACKAFRNVLSVSQVQQSMSRKGDCWDNSVAESFFKSLKVEAIYGFQLKTKDATKAEVFDYIEVWYNRKRRHSYIDYLTIEEKEIIDNICFSNVA